MSNKEIIKILQLTASLMELHEVNDFKVRGYRNAVFNLEKTDATLSTLSLSELEKLDAVGKSLAGKIDTINQTGSFQELEELLQETPGGVQRLLKVKGIGPKKIKHLWRVENIDTPDKLMIACKEGAIAKMKGFGEKTQQTILENLEFVVSQQGKFLYAEVEGLADELLALLKKSGITIISLSGDIRRQIEVVETIQFLVATENINSCVENINGVEALEQNIQQSGPFTWRGKDKLMGANVEVKFYPEELFGNMLYKHSASPYHLMHEYKEGTSIAQLLSIEKFKSETSIFDVLQVKEISPELREGLNEWKTPVENLITDADLKGILHNHSTFSDGKHTLEEMANCCKGLGYEYLGISDHSKTAFYANGLDEDRILQQQEEIDVLNKKLTPFKIFKGIESDILNDGSLDYSDEVLKSFDFIVSSIHSNLNMDKAKATERLIRAIENPYTTILGHMTGRLLLRREGYPIDHEKVIDACAANGVIIEINANPWRLDIDWRWIPYALEKEVMLSINPDAHEMEGYKDMRYGVIAGRKGGLTKKMTFNTKNLNEVMAYFEKK